MPDVNTLGESTRPNDMRRMICSRVPETLNGHSGGGSGDDVDNMLAIELGTARATHSRRMRLLCIGGRSRFDMPAGRCFWGGPIKVPVARAVDGF